MIKHTKVVCNAMISRNTIPFPNLSSMAINTITANEIDKGTCKSVTRAKIKMRPCNNENMYCLIPDTFYDLIAQCYVVLKTTFFDSEDHQIASVRRRHFCS